MEYDFFNKPRCDLCKSKDGWGFELHELSPDVWAVVCGKCVSALELNEGK